MTGVINRRRQCAHSLLSSNLFIVKEGEISNLLFTINLTDMWLNVRSTINCFDI